MRLQKLILTILSLGMILTAHANEIMLTADQPMTITFRIVHKKQNSQPIFGALKTINLNKNATIPIDLNNYDRTGVTIISVNGHELPSSINQFDQPRQCSMTTDKTRATAALDFTLSGHSISCRTFGGVFG